MRAVVQRVSSASVTVAAGGRRQRPTGSIEQGVVALVGVERDDGPDDVQYIASKIRDLRIFADPADSERHLNCSVEDIGGSVLVVSQFTLAGDCRKGRRPSFDRAAPPDDARILYEDLIRALQGFGLTVATGEFRATMQVALVNDGPVTLLLDSRKQF